VPLIVALLIFPVSRKITKNFQIIAFINEIPEQKLYIFKRPTNSVFTKILGPYPITHEFLNFTMEKTSTDTITDSSF
jgi:hypothetical protein